MDEKTGAPLPSFSATLLPHRSLPRKEFVVLMLAIAAVSFVSGAVFVAVGAWPVTGFVGLDALLVYLSFRRNYRDGRLREKIELREGKLNLTRVHPSGKAESFSFNPYWVRFRHQRQENAAGELSLSSHGRALIFGAFLSEGEKENFAQAFSQALAAHRAP